MYDPADPLHETVQRHKQFPVGALVTLIRSVFQLMCDRVSGNNKGLSKRIRDGNVRNDRPDQDIDLIQRLRTEGAGRMEPW